MTSKQVKNQVRDSVEQGIDCLHRVADVVTFPLAPLDGAIHGTARGMLNWLTDTHPKQHKYGGGGGGGGGCGGGRGGGGRGGGGGGGGGDGGYPGGIDPDRRGFNFKGNEINGNKGDAKGFNNFGNRRNRGPYSGNSEFGFENNKIKGNEGKAEGFQDFGNDY